MEYGLTLIAVIAIMGGLIAFLGDKIGSKVGKKRIRLFGLRPHNTSILVTVFTGILIAAATIGVMAILSNNVRTALFGMHQLEERMTELNHKIDRKNKLIKANQELLEIKQKDLNQLTDQIGTTSAELEQVQYQRDLIAGKLVSVETAYKEANRKLAKSESDIQNLEHTKKELNNYIGQLEVVKTDLESTVTQLREGHVIFSVGQVLSGAVIKPGLTEEQYELTLTKFLNDTNKLVVKKLDWKGKGPSIFVYRENVMAIAKMLTQAKGPMLVRTIAAGNVVAGEPTVTTLTAQPYLKVYSKDQLVYQKEILAGENAEIAVLAFLKDMNKVAVNAGILPNVLTGKVGDLPGNELYRTINLVRRMDGKVVLKAYTTRDVYTEGPLTITIRVMPAS